jgi:hypothetical protein
MTMIADVSVISVSSARDQLENSGTVQTLEAEICVSSDNVVRYVPVWLDSSNENSTRTPVDLSQYKLVSTLTFPVMDDEEAAVMFMWFVSLTPPWYVLDTVSFIKSLL